MRLSKLALSLVLLLAICSSVTFAQGPVPYCGRQPGSPKNEAFLIPPLEAEGNPVLRQVQAYIRHGDRMIASNGQCWVGDDALYNCTMSDSSIPNTDPREPRTGVPRLYRMQNLYDRNYFPGNCILGQLTQQGYAQHVANGQNFRQAYVDQAKLLSPELNTNELFLRSDDVSRTIQSAESLIIGLYPLEDAGIATLVNLYTVDYGLDDINPNSNLCPALAGYNTLALNTTASQEFNASNTHPLFEQLAPLVGVNTSSQVDIWQVWDCLNVHLCHDLPVPEALVNLYPTVQQNMLFYANQTYTYPNPITHGQVSSGLLINEMLGYMNNIKGGETEDPKLIIWSSHDTSLMSFLNAFQVWDGQWTPYASTVNIELYENSSTQSGWAIRLVYNGKVLYIPGCPTDSDLCDFDTFNGIAQKLIPTSEQCQFPAATNRGEFKHF